MKYEQKLVIRILLVLFLLLLPIDLFYELLLEPTIRTSGYFLSAYMPEISYDAIIINDYLLRFVPACIASIAYTLLAILILTTKNIPWEKRILMFIVGSATIFGANIIRIVYLARLLIEKGLPIFHEQHLFIWNFVSTIFVVVIWIGIIKVFKIKNIPVISDFKTLTRHLKKQE